MFSLTIDILLHFHMLPTAAGRPGWSKRGASLIQMASLAVRSTGRCSAPSSTLINFRRASLLVNPCSYHHFCSVSCGFAFIKDIKIIRRCAQEAWVWTPPPPFILHGPSMTRAWRQLSCQQARMTVSLCLNPNTGAFLSLLSLQQAGHMADIHRPRFMPKGARCPRRSRWCQRTAAAGCSYAASSQFYTLTTALCPPAASGLPQYAFTCHQSHVWCEGVMKGDNVLLLVHFQ